MRSRSVHLALLAGVVMVGLLALPEAAAAGRWGFSAHGGFRVGGFDFSVGYHHRHQDPHHRGVPYYRVDRSISHSGYRCGSACYRSEGSYYHHNACPLVLQHFRRYGYVPRRSSSAYQHHDYRYRGDARHDYRSRGDSHHDYRYRGDRRYDYRYRRDSRHDHRYRDRRDDRRYRGEHRYDYRERDNRRYDRDHDRRGAHRTRPRHRDH